MAKTTDISEKITLDFRGAAKTVSGSMFIVTAKTKHGTKKIMVDCGLDQGGDKRMKIYEKNLSKIMLGEVEDIDAVIITHAHIDHSGFLPRLVKLGYKGPIYCTHLTAELLNVVLPDSAHIQEEEGFRKKRVPLYEAADALVALKLLKPCAYSRWYDLNGIRFILKKADHILGSAFVEMSIEDDGGYVTNIIFSGDIGSNVTSKFTTIPHIIVSESTYGHKLNDPPEETDDLKIARIIIETTKNGGKIFIPSFTVERVQRVLYSLKKAYEKLEPEEIEILKSVPIFIDTPMGIEINEIYADKFFSHPESFRHILGDDLEKFVEKKCNPFQIPNLKYSKSATDSMALQALNEPVVIIAGSGMCDHGRIRHHLKTGLLDSRNSVVFVGYVAEGSTGRRILERQKGLKIFGEEVAINARVYSISTYSAHADQASLLNFIKKSKVPPRAVFLVHGEEKAQGALRAELIKLLSGIKIIIPNRADQYFIDPDCSLKDFLGNVIVSDLYSHGRDISPEVRGLLLSGEKTAELLTSMDGKLDSLEDGKVILSQEELDALDMYFRNLGTIFKAFKSKFSNAKRIQKRNLS